MASSPEETTGPDTQLVGQLLWEELHENGTQQPVRFEWMSTPVSPAATLQPLAAIPSRLSTPEIVTGFCVPPNLVSWRQRLFEFNGGEKITLSSEQWRLYWPFVTNIWTRHSPPYVPKWKQTIRTHWSCRFHKEKAEISLGTGQRGKKTRRAIGCPAKLTEIQDVLSDSREYTIDGRHNHLLEDLDLTKVNEAIQSWVELQPRQGFSAMAIDKVAKGKGKDSTSAQNC
jgi:2,5-diamino-6-(ribosylamino)-4(3H)-pyrimidinone 5'-phosphate reductase